MYHMLTPESAFRPYTHTHTHILLCVLLYNELYIGNESLQ